MENFELLTVAGSQTDADFFGTHLKTLPGRDIGHFLKAQGVRAKVYPLRYSEPETTQRFLKMAISL